MFFARWTTAVRSLLAGSLVLVFAAVMGVAALGEDAAVKAPAEPQTLRELIDSSTSWYEVFPNSEAKDPAKPLIALRWANNARGSEDGMTLLFVHDGVPLATACVYPWAKRLEFGFGSLSRDKIVARRDGAVIWQPQESDVRFTDIPGAPAPDDTRPARLRQMKVLAERFQAAMLGWKADSTDREELRLLPRPLFRYDPRSGNVIDGVVFAFVIGTDPEVLMLIEAVKSGDQTKWQYAFVRRTSGKLEARLDNAVVWQVDKFPRQHDPRLPYFTIGTPLPPDIIAVEVQVQQRTPRRLPGP